MHMRQYILDVHSNYVININVINNFAVKGEKYAVTKYLLSNTLFANLVEYFFENYGKYEQISKYENERQTSP